MGELVTIDAGHDLGRARLLQSLLDADDVVARLVEPSGLGPYPGLENYRLLVRSDDESRARDLVATLRPAPRRTRPMVRVAGLVLVAVVLGPLLSSVIMLIR